ncbi:MarR family EPS-associated transcriptional regulator [Teredinibacter franksiae]|uniref:MarR family EPS-associated transcriptional regulator n=1 Tax=Teredinibacter franksiae TaxID=2761453 RepID=UPI001624AD47|nr:MarR family EPS-associated transcriptional regulator [Teredinibacter franksiae]
MTETQLPDELRYQLLKQLERNPEISQRELAKAVGISLGKTNYCLKALVEAGWVKAGNFARSEQKLNYVYLLTPKGLSEKAEVTVRFLKRKQVQYQQLEHEIASLKKEAFAQRKN